MSKTIELTRGKVALVDDEDFELVSRWRWVAMRNPKGGNWYAIRRDWEREGAPTVYMHRVIIGARRGEHVDHRNGHGLDNRRANLRTASPQQNSMNMRRKSNASSRYKGVSWNKSRSKWEVRIKADGKNLYLGRFADEEEAARSYDRAAVEHFGEFARTNRGSAA